MTFYVITQDRGTGNLWYLTKMSSWTQFIEDAMILDTEMAHKLWIDRAGTRLRRVKFTK